jgi:heme-binding NEAT domain protein
MQKDQSQQAANCMAQNQEKESSGNPGTSTPKKVCAHSSPHTVSRPSVTPRPLSKVAKTSIYMDQQIIGSLCLSNHRRLSKKAIRTASRWKIY